LRRYLLCVDARAVGSVARFINSSNKGEKPNLIIQVRHHPICGH
jgi:hypothetical protein